MVLFFFVIGLEIKREITIGELSNPRVMAAPIAGAIGGVLLPLAIFLLIAQGSECATCSSSRPWVCRLGRDSGVGHPSDDAWRVARLPDPVAVTGPARRIRRIPAPAENSASSLPVALGQR